MARLPRAEVPGWPQLVQQRSHDGVPWIRDEVDGLRALADLKEVSAAAGVQVHAYAIVAEQMLLLVTPDAPAGVSRMMQAFGRRYVGAFNRRHARAGSNPADNRMEHERAAQMGRILGQPVGGPRVAAADPDPDRRRRPDRGDRRGGHARAGAAPARFPARPGRLVAP